MKALVLFLLVFAIPVQWEPDFDTAKQTAKQQHKMILLNFSGSDWCGPCIVTKRDYFENEVFQAMAKENLVMVNADFPRKKKNSPSAEVVKRNEALAEMYNKQGMFPLTLLLDADGKVIKTWSGKPDVTPEKWAEEIRSVCESRR